MSIAASKWMPAGYFLLGQLGWFACILSAAHGAPWIGVAVVAILIGAHLWHAPRWLEEGKFIAVAVAVGAVWESALLRFHLLAYPSGTVIHGLAPDWIVALWALFAAQFNTTYVWLKARLALASLLGAIAGPASFRAGAALGALTFARPRTAVWVLALGWAGVLPLLIILSRRWDGVRANRVS